MEDLLYYYTKGHKVPQYVSLLCCECDFYVFNYLQVKELHCQYEEMKCFVYVMNGQNPYSGAAY